MEKKAGMKVGPVKVIGEWVPNFDGLRLTVNAEMVPAVVGGHGGELGGIIPMLGETVIILRTPVKGDCEPVEHLRAVLAGPRES